MKSLSILLPTYNCYCVKLVETLHSQCEAIIGLCYEIIVADDGSPEKEYIVRNREIERLTNVRYIFSEENVGRSRIRNILVREAQYEWILFIDGDLALENPLFVKNYLEAKGDIIVGGIEILNLQGTKCNVLQKGNLRWLVEQEHVSKNSAAYRRRHVLELHTNFLVCRNTMIKYPFDESFMRYGYEDVMLGKTLVEAGLHVEHIDNPVLFVHFEDNMHFLKKTEEALQTLYEFRNRLKGVSQLLFLADLLERFRLTPLLRFSYKILKHPLRKNLQGNNPNIFLFKIYKLFYYVHLEA